MSFDITAWMNELIARLQNAFGSRLTAVGLQGSFKRGDYHAQSDIDAVVILNKLTPTDMAAYKAVLSQMPASSHPVCGFLGGQDDLKNWSRAELFQFGQDTRWLYGTADGLLPPPTRGDARLAAQSGAGTVYHALVHTWVHGQLTAELIKELRKSLFFALQAAHYARTGIYLSDKKTLAAALPAPEKSALLPTPAQTPEEAAADILTCCQGILAECAQSPTAD